MTYIAKNLAGAWWVYDRTSASFPIALAGYGMVSQSSEVRALSREEADAEAERLNRYFGRPM